MNYLIDTNAWIGFFEGRRDFGKDAKARMIADPESGFISSASVWEAAIKLALGMLRLPYDLEGDLPRMIEENGFRILDLGISDAAAVQGLEPVHRDPFDRVQVVQARKRQWHVISRDSIFESYGLRRIW